MATNWLALLRLESLELVILIRHNGSAYINLQVYLIIQLLTNLVSLFVKLVLLVVVKCIQTAEMMCRNIYLPRVDSPCNNHSANVYICYCLQIHLYSMYTTTTVLRPSGICLGLPE